MDTGTRGSPRKAMAKRRQKHDAALRSGPDGQALYHFDVSPILEENWTGIPCVAGGLAGALLKAAPDQVRFVFDQYVLPIPLIAEALDRRSGIFLRREVNQSQQSFARIDATRSPGCVSVGIWPSVKRQRRLFDVECSVIHDLSTLITPQFHTHANIAYHMETIVGDIASNDVTICVSETTRTDLEAYLGVEAARLAVAYNGVDWPSDFPIRLASEVARHGVEPYLFVLGTREPRKNIHCLLRAIELHPELLETTKIVITGQIGWLSEREVLPPAIKREVARGRIVFTGFLDDYQKYKLLSAAAATVYPSYYEGFGLPVLESLSVGTPCVASFSSAIPEAGGALCEYHDPFSPEDLYQAIRRTLKRDAKTDPAFQAACRDWSARFTWASMLEAILASLAPFIVAA